MRDSKIVVLAEKVEGAEVPQCIRDMYHCINNPRDFRAALAAGERLFSQYKYNQAGTPPMSIPELCVLFDIGKTKLYEILHGSKYGKEEATEKKPLKWIKPEPVEKTPPKKAKKMEENTKATPTT